MPENKRYCSNCGAEIDYGAKFCGYCGESVKIDVDTKFEPVAVTIPATEYDSPNFNDAQYNQVNLDLEEKLIGNKSYYYKEKFKKMRQTGSFISWNWCAFIFNALWFVYRKMYLETLCIIAASYLLSSMASEIAISNIAIPIVCGLFANYIYMKKIEGKVAHAEQLSAMDKESYIMKARGTNFGAVLLLLFLYSFVIIGLAFVIFQFMAAI